MAAPTSILCDVDDDDVVFECSVHFQSLQLLLLGVCMYYLVEFDTWIFLLNEFMSFLAKKDKSFFTFLNFIARKHLLISQNLMIKKPQHFHWEQ